MQPGVLFLAVEERGREEEEKIRKRKREGEKKGRKENWMAIQDWEVG